MNEPRIIVFDSGLGGLTVLKAIHDLIPGAAFLYVADDAAFPYGDMVGPDVIGRVRKVMDRVMATGTPDAVVVACNTASTMVMSMLRARYKVPFIGTVPAIKPAAEITKSGLVSVLATPGTIERDYTRALIRSFASHVHVRLIGSSRLATLAEQIASGKEVPDDAISAEIAPAFLDQDDRKTDAVVLGCTHYPLIIDRLKALALWDVEWINPAPAIARQVATVLNGREERTEHRVSPAAIHLVFSSGRAADDAVISTMEHIGLPRPFIGSDH